MKFTAKQIAEILQGEIVGNHEEEVYKLSKIEEGEKGSLTFLANPKYNSYIYTTKASVTIVNTAEILLNIACRNFFIAINQPSLRSIISSF